MRFVFCFYCGRQLTNKTKTRDHKLPRSRGGSNGSGNIVNACKICNRDKGNLHVEEFRLVMAFRAGVLSAIADFPFPGEMKLEQTPTLFPIERARPVHRRRHKNRRPIKPPKL